MLGEQIAEVNGKIICQRVLDVEGPTIETSVAASGSYKGTQVKGRGTFVGRPTSTGVLRSEGRGVIIAGESEMATFTVEGVGRITPSGSVNWRGSLFYRTSSTGKLAFLNNLVGVFEAVINAEGNFSEKVWEWK
jgi:hypothetical protein